MAEAHRTSEQWVPEPSPESNGYHNLHPPRCSVCRSILQTTTYPHEGFCSHCGEIVTTNYSLKEKGKEDAHDLPV